MSTPQGAENMPLLHYSCIIQQARGPARRLALQGDPCTFAGSPCMGPPLFLCLDVFGRRPFFVVATMQPGRPGDPCNPPFFRHCRRPRPPGRPCYHLPSCPGRGVPAQMLVNVSIRPPMSTFDNMSPRARGRSSAATKRLISRIHARAPRRRSRPQVLEICEAPLCPTLAHYPLLAQDRPHVARVGGRRHTK